MKLNCYSAIRISEPEHPTLHLRPRNAAALSLLFAATTLASPAATGATPEAERGTAHLVEGWGDAPLSFEVNRGQAPAGAAFVSRSGGYSLMVRSEGGVDLYRAARSPREGAEPEVSGDVTQCAETFVRMRFPGSTAGSGIHGVDLTPTLSHYLIGGDPGEWHTGIPHYNRVQQLGVYPGVDVLYYGNEGRLEWDFVVAPETDPAIIRLAFQGVEQLSLDADGSLLLETASEPVRLARPFAYQTLASGRVEVASSYVLDGRNEVRFDLASYDRTKPLVIDPVYLWAESLGSGGAWGEDLVADSTGHIWVTGYTGAGAFPITTGALQPAHAGFEDAFLTKLDPAGNVLYSTYLGGTSRDRAHGIALDADGNIYLAGDTFSGDFPTSVGAYQTTVANQEAFVTKLDPTGTTILYSTFFGGSGTDSASAVAVNAAGEAFITGRTLSANLPVTSGVFDPTYTGPLSGSHGGDGFVTKLNATGTGLVYSSFLGADRKDAGADIALDSSGNAIVVGSTGSVSFPTLNAIQPVFGGGFFSSDGFVTKINPTGTALLYSTFLGGVGHADRATAVAIDSAGSAYVTGQTLSVDFPLTAGAYSTTCVQVSGVCRPDAFATKLSAAGALVYSTLLGNTTPGGDVGNDIALDPTGQAYITGNTFNGIPRIDPVQGLPGPTNFCRPCGLAFVQQLDATGSNLLFSSQVGTQHNGRGNSIVFRSGDVYVAGVASTAAVVHKLGDVGPSNQTPEAICTDRTTDAGANLCNAVTSIDNGSFDPDGDPFTLTEDPSSPYGLGETQVTLTIEDDSTTDTCQGTVTVVDVTAPSLSDLAEPIEAECTSPTGTPVSVPLPLATDACDGPLAVSSDAPATFLLGPTTITFSAADAADNSTQDATQVTVVDTTAPDLVCPGPVEVAADDMCQAAVALGAQVTDICDPGVTVNSDSPGTFELGLTSVLFATTDASGNPASCSTPVTVIDVTAPTVVVAEGPSSLWPPNHKYHTISVDDLVAGVSDACGVNLSAADVVISAVSSDEPEDVSGGGDGHTIDDIVLGPDCRSVEVRAERQGGGNGRVYTIALGLTDASGNIGTASYQVVVPHSKKDTAIDDGPVHSVACEAP